MAVGSNSKFRHGNRCRNFIGGGFALCWLPVARQQPSWPDELAKSDCRLADSLGLPNRQRQIAVDCSCFCNRLVGVDACRHLCFLASSGRTTGGSTNAEFMVARLARACMDC